ncbi:hypothetical protein [Colwellia sp. Arc7-635]|uniref:hypothetical protein n=1 Tax=Colwellia sp. Arc7-635 TaxID=2497879 RepID=UPI0013DF859E|nr:hypothetical protein [Colwellia sp. Arc7-635]
MNKRNYELDFVYPKNVKEKSYHATHDNSPDEWQEDSPWYVCSATPVNLLAKQLRH